MSTLKMVWAALAALALSACGGADDTEDLGSATERLAADRCDMLFGARFEITGDHWSVRLSRMAPSGLSTRNVAVINSDEGFFEDCGRSDAQGSYKTNFWPWDPDFEMKLSLESASCGTKTVVISGDCNADGKTGSASWNGRTASVNRIAN